jgi:hypothetical protein
MSTIIKIANHSYEDISLDSLWQMLKTFALKTKKIILANTPRLTTEIKQSIPLSATKKFASFFFFCHSLIEIKIFHPLATVSSHH